VAWWNGGVMVRLLARDTKGRGFDSLLLHFQVTALGKLLIGTGIYCCTTLVKIWTNNPSVLRIIRTVMADGIFALKIFF